MAAPTSRDEERRDREARIRQVGREIFAQSAAAEPTVFQPDWWQQRILEWAMHDARLRARLFRFTDVLPSLASGRQVAEHLAEYLLHGDHVLPPALERALRFGAATSLTARAAALAARRNVRQLGRRFIAGETAAEAIATVARLRKRRLAFTLDVLGEAVTSESQADAYARSYLDLIDSLSRAAADWKAAAQIDEGPDRVAPGSIRCTALPRVNVSLKLSALDSRFDPISARLSAAAVAERLRPILRLARERGAFVNADMEEHATKDLILDVVRSVLLEDEFRDFPDVGLVLQAYLKDTPRDLDDLLAWVRERGHPVTVRLVKGAYWDMETTLAAQRGWPCPVFTRKWETDASFERLARALIDNHELLHPAIASHNVRSLAAAIVAADARGLSPRDFELQMLFGMGDPLKSALVERGLRVRIYTPYGPLIPGMGYLIRRLLENTSNDSFLRQSFTEDVPVDELLADPAEARPPSSSPAPTICIDAEDEVMPEPFRNEPQADFSGRENREAMSAALADVRGRCGGEYSLVLGGAAVASAETLASLDPSHVARIVGRVACASVEHAERAVAAAREAWPVWRAVPVKERSALLGRLADGMRRRRFELAAWIILESGKPWREADADVCEAIDFCGYYAGEMERLAGRPRRRNVPGEENFLVYEPRGVAAIISPWNFPLAILTGMTAAALVTGNTVVVKPAEQSSVIAAKFFELLTEAGLPDGVANFLAGRGEEVGAFLVSHPDVALIAFTGSRQVGLDILRKAAEVGPGQRMVKRVIAEMGGKNAIIIDEDADLDEAVGGVVASAFGYAGQKCSACSRVIVLRAVHDVFVRRLIETTRSLRVGPAEDPATMVGPVIDDEARRKVLGYVELGEREAELVCRVEHDDPGGTFVGPVIFDGVSPSARIAREEIFGPVLAVLTAASFDEAITIANDSDYALTGGLYSRSPRHIAQAKRMLGAGNLYINRSITGALVDRQPFGGFKLSGIGSKAGGPDYLRQFCVPKTITENTIRHGFAPSGEASDGGRG